MHDRGKIMSLNKWKKQIKKIWKLSAIWNLILILMTLFEDWWIELNLENPLQTDETSRVLSECERWEGDVGWLRALKKEKEMDSNHDGALFEV